MENMNEQTPKLNNSGAEQTGNQPNVDPNNQQQLNNAKPNWDSDDNPYKKDALTYKGKFEHAKKKLKELSEDNEPTSESNSAPQSTPQNNNGDARVDIMFQKIQHPELEMSDITEISTIAKTKGVSFEEALALPIVKNALEYKKQQIQNNNASLNSTRSPISGSAEISKLTEAEKREIFTKAIQGRR